MLMEIIRADLETEIRERLDLVTDPELDEPVTDMGFIERVEVVDASRVEVEFRLPTYWCSPNFAFLMAFGIRSAITSLPWVKSVTVHLKDHCFGDKVNEGVNSGRSFPEIFADYCDGADLGEIVEKFETRAFDRRQEAMLLALRKQGLSDGEILSMTLGQFDRICFAEAEDARQKPRYRDLLLSGIWPKPRRTGPSRHGKGR